MSDIVRVRLQWILLAITLVISAGGWISVLAGDRRVVIQQLSQHDAKLSQLETARQHNESQLVEIRTDVRWIRQAIERQLSK